MKIRILSLLMLATTGSMADLSIPYNQTAKDSSEVQAAYYAKAASNAETSTRLSSDGTSLTLDVTWGHSVGKEYGASASILQPLNSSWKPKDFTGVAAVSFEYKTDAKTTAEFSLSSPLYKGDASNSGVMMLAELAAATSWKTKIISLPDGIGFLKWMTDADTKNGTSYASQSWDDVKSQIKALQFSPKPNYTSATALGLPATTSMSIRNLVIVGGETNPGPQGAGCTGISQLLADFNNSNPKQNYQGGWWYAFSDTASNNAGDANGSSAIVTSGTTVDGMAFQGNGGVPGTSGYVGIAADLNKMLNGAYHPYAGWAAIGTGFKGPEGDIALDLGSGFTAFSFDIMMGDGNWSWFDTGALVGVDFKVGKASVPDSVTWHIGIPYTMSGQNICVDASILQQPAWYTSKLATIPTFTANDITKLLWEIKIQNQDATLKATTPTSSLGNRFYVGNVKIWNAVPGVINKSNGISSRRVGGKSALVASYANGLVLSYALEGAASTKVDVVRMDGSKAASFDAPASASSRLFSMNLARGSYLAVVKGGKTSLVAPFAVAK